MSDVTPAEQILLLRRCCVSLCLTRKRRISSGFSHFLWGLPVVGMVALTTILQTMALSFNSRFSSDKVRRT